MARYILRETFYLGGLLLLFTGVIPVLMAIPAGGTIAALIVLPFALWGGVGSYSFAFNRLEPLAWNLLVAAGHHLLWQHRRLASLAKPATTGNSVVSER